LLQYNTPLGDKYRVPLKKENGALTGARTMTLLVDDDGQNGRSTRWSCCRPRERVDDNDDDDDDDDDVRRNAPKGENKKTKEQEKYKRGTKALEIVENDGALIRALRVRYCNLSDSHDCRFCSNDAYIISARALILFSFFFLFFFSFLFLPRAGM